MICVRFSNSKGMVGLLEQTWKEFWPYLHPGFFLKNLLALEQLDMTARISFICFCSRKRLCIKHLRCNLLLKM